MAQESGKILVTGADGFIGSHLVEMLLKKGHKVRALSYYNSFNYWGWLEAIPAHPQLEIVSGDVRDPHFCREITKGVDTIYHLAALIAIPYSYVAPDSYIDTNVKGTLNICQAAKDNGVTKILVTSTSEVYGTAQYVPIDEKHPLQAQSPYSASKIGADAIAMSYFNAFNLPVTIVRPFNTYGPRQSARAIIPTIISQIAAGVKTIEVGDLSPTRDFNYVADTCTAFIKIAESKNIAGEVINIGSNYEISMKDTFDLIKKIMKSNVEFVTKQERIRPEKSEVFRLWCDNSRLKALTAYVPEHSIEQGLEKTILWFSNPDHLKNYKTNLYNV